MLHSADTYPTIRPGAARSGGALMAHRNKAARQVPAPERHRIEQSQSRDRAVDRAPVRLHAVAARERDETCQPGHPCPDASGASATAKLTELAMGQTLPCRQAGTSYDRVTAICRNQARVEVNCAMVRSGTAVIWPRFAAEQPICSSQLPAPPTQLGPEPRCQSCAADHNRISRHAAPGSPET